MKSEASQNRSQLCFIIESTTSISSLIHEDYQTSSLWQTWLSVEEIGKLVDDCIDWPNYRSKFDRKIDSIETKLKHSRCNGRCSTKWMKFENNQRWWVPNIWVMLSFRKNSTHPSSSNLHQLLKFHGRKFHSSFHRAFQSAGRFSPQNFHNESSASILTYRTQVDRIFWQFRFHQHVDKTRKFLWTLRGIKKIQYISI